MMEPLADKAQLKELLREAIDEVLTEKKDFFHDLVLEAMEDVALINAIKEGEKTQSVSKE
ncbi:hypothetical protein GWO43_01900 [candidate division KSB1 bacterium]|nr:hypothetical protein [candidate division KSB1 bacterium]NIR69478.1 hypothetical protein [candidate division KSB1 bacterium]NIS22828.1 hypothetical protein [candidate division KSB1 bacterium]NIT69667.1 hypothetical protein [candidate division KSB1 bacterium]NIU23337.1 hypothetical protein [candidate division KSB1 bacterium]